MAWTEAQRAQAASIFATYKAEIDKRELSNTDNYDKHILTLSSAGLALTLTVVKDIVPHSQTEAFGFLYASWIFFGCAILATIFSFSISNLALRSQLNIAQRYYMDEDETAFGEISGASKLLTWVNRISGGCFVLAIVSVITLGIINFDKRVEVNKNVMAKETPVFKNDGLPAPAMQQVNVEKGANVPLMQPLTQTAQTPEVGATPQQPATSTNQPKSE